MKDYNRTMLEAGRPDEDPATTISYCLERLFADKTRTINDEVVKGLTFEELLGALLQARDLAELESEE